MYLNRRQFGQWGENIAKQYLLDHDYQICWMNIYNRYGEIDILALKNGVFHFVEVKTVRESTFGFPEESLTVYKQSCLQRTIIEFIEENEVIEDWQVDLILITVGSIKNKIRLLFVLDYEFDEQVIESF